MSRFLAFDLGAESGRALMGHLSEGRLSLHAIHRFANTPQTVGATLRWNVEGLWAEIRRALALVDSPVVSLGIDTWGCDYALLDARGGLVEQPWHYRDHRIAGVMDRVLARVGRNRVYHATGVQFLPFNTLFQLVAAHQASPSALDTAASVLTIPDLFNYWMTGRVCCEYTNATTTQCVDGRSRTWAHDLLAALDLPLHLFGPIVEPGTIVGPLQASAGGPVGVPVVAPACHDTGSAVAAVAASGHTAFLSSGTWSLLGVEVPEPVITARAAALNFTNEGGVCGTTRLLKNIGGLWLLQACRREWAVDGRAISYDALATAAAGVPPFGPVIDPDAPAFLNPTRMTTAIEEFCRQTGQVPPTTPARMARTIFESLALKYRLVIEWLEEVTGQPVRAIRVIGGGAQNVLLNQLTANATGREVIAGPVEATALGNIAMQMLATNQVTSLAEAREIIDRSFPAGRFHPTDTDRWERHYRRFREVLEHSCV